MSSKFYSCVILALCFSFSSRAQCNTGSIVLSSQAQVDAFPSKYGCSNIDGTLQILNGNDVTNLDSLYQLTSVTTLIIVGNPKLTDIEGLSNITYVSAIHFYDNPEIQDLSGFSSLTTVQSMINLASSPKLKSLHGLEQLRSIGTLSIAFCDLLTDLSPLSGLTKTAGDLHLRHNNGLTSLSGLGNIESIDGTLKLEANAGLITVNGISKLTRTAFIWLVDNPQLLNVDGFSNVELPGLITITGNQKLISLDGLSSVKYASGVWIENNSALTSIRGLTRLTKLTLPGYLYILSNPVLTSLAGVNNIKSLEGSLYIKNNALLSNLNAFRSLTSTGSWEGEGRIEISGNPSLQNVDSLSSLTSMSGINKFLTVTNNPMLIRGCGLYPLIHNNLGCTSDPCATHITISANGPGVTEQGIRDGGPCGGSSPAQCEGTITLASQAEVDAFPSRYGCSTITGTLQINNTTDVTNLDSLYQVTSVGTLIIESNAQLVDIGGLSHLTRTSSFSLAFNPEITNVDGFSALVSAGIFTITDNPKLTNLDGFSSLTSVNTTNIRNNYGLISIQGLSELTTVDAPGDFYITGNSSLISLAGMENISSIPGELRVTSNNALTDLGGFSALTQVGGLFITGNANLTVLPGFENLQTVGNAGCNCQDPGLLVANNAKLANVDGFSSLKSVADNVEIINNPLMANVNGFSHLTSVGRMLQVVSNLSLANLDGLSALTSVGVNTGNGDQSIDISRNAALTSIRGLRNVGGISGSLTIMEDSSLVSLDGLQKIDHVGGRGVEISLNKVLVDTDALGSLTTIAGNLYIKNNLSLTNLNGFRSLTSTTGYKNLGWIEISGNLSLQNVDSLSSLVSMGGTDKTLYVVSNPKLTKACGLYPLLQYGMGCSPGVSCAHIIINGNGSGVTEQSIRNGGPCDGSSPGSPTQPTNLVFSKVTGSTLRLSFTAATHPPSGGYLVLMRHHEAPYPEEGPVDGTAYQVGNVIGNSTIVVGTDLETVSDVVWLAPNTPYYFDIFSYTADNHYVIADYLEGSQTTGDPEPRNNTLVFSNVTDNTMTVSFVADSTADGYVTVMRAHNSSYPDEVPEDGVVYNVGKVIGNSTIVVGMGTETSKDIVSLESDTDYFFEVLSYKIINGYYDYDAENPQSGHQRTNSSSVAMAYPNPFTDNITIPFTVKEENTHVSVVIFDQLGRVVSEVVSQRFDPGDHEVKWDRSDLQGKRVIEGLYMYAIKSSERNRSAQGMVLAK